MKSLYVLLVVFGFAGSVWAQPTGVVGSRSIHEEGSAEETEEHEHQPRHGGYFGDAEDIFHYELVLEPGNRLLFYVNDERNRPLDARTLQGQWTMNPDGPTPTTDLFTPSDDGAYFLAELPTFTTADPLHVLVQVQKAGQWVGLEFVVPRTLVPFETIDQGVDSGYREPGAHVVRTDVEWQQAWDRHTALVSPKPARPLINFGADLVIAVFLGERPTGGFTVTVTAITKRPDALHVLVEETVPSPDTMVTQALTVPYHFVRLKRTDLPIKFEFRAIPQHP